jgi:hypothetical protein
LRPEGEANCLRLSLNLKQIAFCAAFAMMVKTNGYTAVFPKLHKTKLLLQAGGLSVYSLAGRERLRNRKNSISFLTYK